jgi:hypothetical protein
MFLRNVRISANCRTQQSSQRREKFESNIIRLSPAYKDETRADTTKLKSILRKME